jgi:hypothetical protein
MIFSPRAGRAPRVGLHVKEPRLTCSSNGNSYRVDQAAAHATVAGRGILRNTSRIGNSDYMIPSNQTCGAVVQPKRGFSVADPDRLWFPTNILITDSSEVR